MDVLSEGPSYSFSDSINKDRRRELERLRTLSERGMARRILYDAQTTCGLGRKRKKRRQITGAIQAMGSRASKEEIQKGWRMKEMLRFQPRLNGNAHLAEVLPVCHFA